MARKKKKKRQHRLFWFIIKLQIFFMLIVLAGMGYYFYGGYAQTVQDLKAEAITLVMQSDETTFVPARTTQLYDTNGELISELHGDKDAEYVEYEDIPAYFVTAMVSIEDKRFYSHHGVDYKALLRAGKAIIKDKRMSQGGSTITMQLARNIYLDMGKYWQRKVKEMFIAMELEKRFSKSKIMEFYLNNIYFSNGYYGIDAACHGYFDCNLSDLSLSQIAFLCAIPNNPSVYDPITNYDNTIKRRNLILLCMVNDGKISQETYEAAINEQIVLTPPQQKAQSKKNNYVDTYAYSCATKALMQKEGFEFKYYFKNDEEKQLYQEEYNQMYDYCQRKLYSEGYKIYTSIDLNKQQQLQNAIDTQLSGFTEVSDEGVYSLQGAATCIDNNTGLVVAIVGGRSQDFSGYTLNRAYQSHRQPGSSIKPLIVYTPSFERGYTPDSMVDDHEFEGGPSNAGGSYYGNVNVRFAVEQSLNTVAWQLYDQLTPEVGLSYLKAMNFTNIVKSDYVTATALGGFTTGASTVEMASAYSTLVNDGKYREPSCIVSMVDSDENIIYSASSIETIVYKEQAARMMTNVMTGVMTNGTGRSVAISNMPCAGKTGTTNDQKDGWFCGFTRYYTTCVWVGCDIPKKVDGLKGASYPGKIWQEYMNVIHEGLPYIDFLPYAQLSQDFIDNQNQEQTENPEGEEVAPEQQPDPNEGQTNEPALPNDPNQENANNQTTDNGGNAENNNSQNDGQQNTGEQNNNSQNATEGAGDNQENTNNPPEPPAPEENPPIENVEQPNQ